MTEDRKNRLNHIRVTSTPQFLFNTKPPSVHLAEPPQPTAPTPPRKDLPPMSTASTGTPRTFESAVESLILAGTPRIEAVRQIVREHPELHQAYLDRCMAGTAGAIPPDRMRTAGGG